MFTLFCDGCLEEAEEEKFDDSFDHAFGTEMRYSFASGCCSSKPRWLNYNNPRLGVFGIQTNLTRRGVRDALKPRKERQDAWIHEVECDNLG